MQLAVAEPRPEHGIWWIGTLEYIFIQQTFNFHSVKSTMQGAEDSVVVEFPTEWRSSPGLRLFTWNTYSSPVRHVALSSFDRQAVQSHSWKVTGLRFNHMNPCPHSSHDALQSSPFPQGSLTGEKTSLFFIVVQVQLSPFLSHFSTPPPAIPTTHPWSYLPLVLSKYAL